VFKRPGEEPYGVFSNFCAGCPISVAGSTFDSSEHFFQAMKFTLRNSGRERTADGLPFGHPHARPFVDGGLSSMKGSSSWESLPLSMEIVSSSLFEQCSRKLGKKSN
jgi:hypothetical protein